MVATVPQKIPTYTITHKSGAMKIGITTDGKPVKEFVSGVVIVGDVYYPPPNK